MTAYKRLYRSRDNRMIGGVCWGLGEFFGLDPTLIRLIFVLGTLAGGPFVLIYLVMLLVVPEELLAARMVEATLEEDASAAAA